MTPRERIAAAIDLLGPDELELLAVIAERARRAGSSQLRRAARGDRPAAVRAGGASRGRGRAVLRRAAGLLRAKAAVARRYESDGEEEP
jgi:hypothetical protein